MKLDELDEKIKKGLSSAEIPDLRQKYGYNELSTKKERTFLQRLLGVISEPMIFLLISIGIIYLFLGDTSEAILLTCSVVLIVIITLTQEGKTESALSALKSLASPRTNVIRDGILKKVDGREILPGDIIVLNEGDRVPADSRVLSTEHLLMDESLLTGESVPVLKKAEDKVFCGSLVSAGQAICFVQLIGNQTKIGIIGQTISTEAHQQTLLEKEVGILVRWIFIFAVIICSILAIFLGIVKNDWLGGILSGLTLAIGILPEELPLVLTIFFAFGAYRLSKKNVLTRKTSIIETLGAATVLCTDKTGTITQNKMTLKCFVDCDGVLSYASESDHLSSENFKSLLFHSLLACKPNAFDPMDRAFFEFDNHNKEGEPLSTEGYVLQKEFPISHKLLAFTQVWENNGNFLVATKGAPEAIIELCKMRSEEKELILKRTSELANLGYRMLAVAKSKIKLSMIPKTAFDCEYEWLGLAGLEDPIRPDVPTAVRTAYTAGIRIIMITGDYPETARSIANQIGLVKSENVMTGEMLSHLSVEKYRTAVLNCNIFSRVSPEEKWKIVRVLKNEGEIVAMTGDGVNDAPALKAANIGVAMGERGTDVAREAAAIVLLDDSFSSLLGAVEEGRHIYINLKKALGYIIAVHIPIIGATFFPILLNLPHVILSAVHIVFLEMIIDPTSTLVFEKEAIEEGTMNSPPRRVENSLLDKNLFIVSVIQGLFSLFAVVGTYWYIINYEFYKDSNPLLGSTAAFVTLIFSNLLLILVNRSQTRTIVETIRVKNQMLPYVTLGTILILFLALYVPFLQKIFHFAPLSLKILSECILISLFSIVWFEIGKLLMRKRFGLYKHK